MPMLRWICGKTLKDRISNKHIRELVGVAPIEDKMRENRLQWLDTYNENLQMLWLGRVIF